jgi:DNA-binding response OmpR family regulator
MRDASGTSSLNAAVFAEGPWAPLPPDRITVLIVGGEDTFAAALAAASEREGWHVDVAPTLVAGCRELDSGGPRLVIVDRRLPDGDGFALLRRFPPRPGIGVVLLAEDLDETDRIVALELGADAAVAMPCSRRELTTRMRALARRLSLEACRHTAHTPKDTVEPDTAVRIGPATADTRRRVLTTGDGRRLRLSGAEAAMISLLAAAGGQPVARDRAAREVLGMPTLAPGQRAVDRLAFAVRRKLADATAGAAEVLPVRNHGYRLAV